MRFVFFQAVSEAAVNLVKLSPQDRVELMRKRRTLLTEIASLLNRCEDVLLLKKSSSHQMSTFLVGADKLKYGLKALRRAIPVDLEAISGQIATLSKVLLYIVACVWVLFVVFFVDVHRRARQRL